jgi:hypothetical protein
MEVRQGDRVLVNVAPFIGSLRRHKESVPCTVLATESARVQVRTENPYREVTLWVPSSWIEQRLGPKECSGAASNPAFREGTLPTAKVREKATRRSPSLSAV